MRGFIITVVLGLLFMTTPAIADDYSTSHMWDHMGTSYAIQTFTYGFSEKVLGLERSEAIPYSMFTTFVITFTYSYFAAMQTGKLQTNDLIYNSIGQLGAVGTILMFKF